MKIIRFWHTLIILALAVSACGPVTGAITPIAAATDIVPTPTQDLSPQMTMTAETNALATEAAQAETERQQNTGTITKVLDFESRLLAEFRGWSLTDAAMVLQVENLAKTETYTLVFPGDEQVLYILAPDGKWQAAYCTGAAQDTAAWERFFVSEDGAVTTQVVLQVDGAAGVVQLVRENQAELLIPLPDGMLEQFKPVEAVTRVGVNGTDLLRSAEGTWAVVPEIPTWWTEMANQSFIPEGGTEENRVNVADFFDAKFNDRMREWEILDKKAGNAVVMRLLADGSKAVMVEGKEVTIPKEWEVKAQAAWHLDTEWGTFNGEPKVVVRLLVDDPAGRVDLSHLIGLTVPTTDGDNNPLEVEYPVMPSYEGQQTSFDDVRYAFHNGEWLPLFSFAQIKDNFGKVPTYEQYLAGDWRLKYDDVLKDLVGKKIYAAYMANYGATPPDGYTHEINIRAVKNEGVMFGHNPVVLRNMRIGTRLRENDYTNMLVLMAEHREKGVNDDEVVVRNLVIGNMGRLWLRGSDEIEKSPRVIFYSPMVLMMELPPESVRWGMELTGLIDCLVDKVTNRDRVDLNGYVILASEPEFREKATYDWVMDEWGVMWGAGQLIRARYGESLEKDFNTLYQEAMNEENMDEKNTKLSELHRLITLYSQNIWQIYDTLYVWSLNSNSYK